MPKHPKGQIWPAVSKHNQHKHNELKDKNLG